MTLTLAIIATVVVTWVLALGVAQWLDTRCDRGLQIAKEFKRRREARDG